MTRRSYPWLIPAFLFVSAAALAQETRPVAEPPEPAEWWRTDGPTPDTSTNYITDESPAAEFSLGIGYANLSIGGSDSVIDSEGALRFDGIVSFSPLQNLPQLRLGAGAGVTLVLDNSQWALVSSGGAVFVGHADVPLWLIEPEVRLSWRQTFGRHGEFYVEPGVGAGVVYAKIEIDGEDTSSGQSFDESDTVFEGRAFVNVGARVTGGLAGIQFSYARGDSLDLAENASGDFEEFYVGIFGSLRF